MEKSKRGKLLLIIGVVVGILVGFGSYFVYDNYFSKNDVENKEENKNNDEDKKDNSNNPKLMSTEDKKNLINELVSTNVLEKAMSLDELKNSHLGTNIDAKIDNNGYFSITYDNKTEKYDKLGPIKDVYSFYNNSAIPNMLFVTKNNKLYYGYPMEYQVEEVENKDGKTVISSYVDNNTGDKYILFDDYSLINLTSGSESNKYILGENILDKDFILDGLGIYVMCSDYCSPADVTISFDGKLKIKDNDNKYVELKYNNKSVDFKYGYYKYNNEYTDANIYFVDTNNNVYMIKNYTKDNRSTKLEKLSYKFDSLNVTKTEDNTNKYTIKYDYSTTLDIDSYAFVDITKYSKIFELYNK